MNCAERLAKWNLLFYWDFYMTTVMMATSQNDGVKVLVEHMRNSVISTFESLNRFSNYLATIFMRIISYHYTRP